MNEMSIPQCITDKFMQLNQLAEQFPENIPVNAVAKFLDCDGQSVRAYLMMPYSFGMGWKKDSAASRGFLIPTAKFYTWYCNLMIMRT